MRGNEFPLGFMEKEVSVGFPGSIPPSSVPEKKKKKKKKIEAQGKKLISL